MSKLSTIKEILGYVSVGGVCIYLYSMAETGSLISVILLLSCISCFFLSISAFNLEFRSKSRFKKGDTLSPSKINFDYADEDKLVILNVIDNQYVCQHETGIKYIRFGDEKYWIVGSK